MTGSIRIKRLQKQALQTASQVVLYELHDPRLALVTLTRVKLTNDLSYATIFWSSISVIRKRLRRRAFRAPCTWNTRASSRVGRRRVA